MVVLGAHLLVGGVAWLTGYRADAERGWSQALYGEGTDEACWSRKRGRFFDRDADDDATRD